MKTILIGIDFTKSSENALNYAIEIAEKSNCKILLFHALTAPIIHTNSGLFLTAEPEFVKGIEGKMEILKTKFLKQHPNLKFNIEVTYSGIRYKIEKLSSKNKIGLVVLGLETKNKISNFIIGTTSVDLVGKINCPIITVPESYQTHRIQKTLIAIDNKEVISSSLSKRLHSLIKILGTKPEFVHVKTEDEININQKLNKQFNIISISSSTFEEGIVSHARKTKADSMILISHRYTAFQSLFFDKHSKKIILNSKIPIISIHK